MDYWKILVVDDDQDVHTVTHLALKRVEYDEKKIMILNAKTAEEAKQVLNENPDIAVILLDIVMENEAAGLSFVHDVRMVQKNDLVQIIIRTGHPGSAPEEQITLTYDINDYQEKSELSARKLKTSVITALRSYRALCTIDEHRKGLKRVIDSSINMFRNQSAVELETLALTNMGKLCCTDQQLQEISGFVVHRDIDGFWMITTGIGRYKEYKDMSVLRIFEPKEWDEVLVADIMNPYYHFNGLQFMRLKLHNDNQVIFAIEDIEVKNEWLMDLLETYRLNVSVALDNIDLYQELELAHNEVVFALGEIAESQSSETGNHVKRVGEIAKILALKLNFDIKEAEKIRMAASMHDLGKLAIQSHILKKPGKLTPEEFDIMKTHSYVGYEMLKSSKRELLQSAAVIALEHHENYDGTGYPNGLKGEEISIESRIVAIADVFDALGNKRVYKESWARDQILPYMKEQAGRKFDPDLMEVFFENIDELLKVRERYPD